MKPIVNRLEKTYTGKISFLRLDVDDPANEPMARQYKLEAIPLFVVLDSAGEVVEMQLGGTTQAVLEKHIKTAMAR